MKGEKSGSDASHSTAHNSLHVVYISLLSKSQATKAYANYFCESRDIALLYTKNNDKLGNPGPLCGAFCCRLKGKTCLRIN